MLARVEMEAFTVQIYLSLQLLAQGVSTRWLGHEDLKPITFMPHYLSWIKLNINNGFTLKAS